MSDGAPRPVRRLDKWLWQARFFKTRSMAARVVAAGHCRVNGTRVTKPAVSVGAGDVLTFVQARRVRVVRITGLPSRRGPAAEAQEHYTDLAPPQERGATRSDDAGVLPDPQPGGRPTKRARRTLETMRRRALE